MKYFIIISLFLFVCPKSFAQSDSSYSILVAGHAYGAHLGKNIGLHPPFLKKLNALHDTSIRSLFLTGDIVNNSTSASWAQVENELSAMPFNSYYVMGNHDDNTVGHAEFQKKFGGIHYYFTFRHELYIVLNSTESDRSISPSQLDFLDQVLENTDSNWNRAFIFFHEVIWNSSIKYRLLRSNSRSRYAQIVPVSNFWQDVYPRFTALPDKKFYLFAGDVGGNPDAVAASYDRWGNVTLLSSGMGEVPDENYMKVKILPDTVTFDLIALNDDIEMKPIEWYNVPEKPSEIVGPSTISVTQGSVNYQVSEVFNATSWRWNLSAGISGTSDSSKIELQFDPGFQTGKISVVAVNDGFGESEPVEMEIKADNNTLSTNRLNVSGFKIIQNEQTLKIICNSKSKTIARLKIYNALGQLLIHDKLFIHLGLNSQPIGENIQFSGIAIVELLVGNERITQKIILR